MACPCLTAASWMQPPRPSRNTSLRGAQISAAVVRQLKDEGIYPYSGPPASRTQAIERQTFDVVVTVARDALPSKGAARRLSVSLIQTALESSPGDLHTILAKVLALSDEDRRHLKNLLDSTDLTHVIEVATTVTNRLNFIGALRKIFADPHLRKDLREVDQLHPMIAKNLWLFGDDWNMAMNEVGLTNVLQAHLEDHLGEDVVLENRLETVTQPDGRTGRVDVLLFRSRRDDSSTERLVIELKRPNVRVGKKELDQIKGYARAIVDDPQYSGVDCKWRFYLITYEYSDKILRDIRQEGQTGGPRRRPPRLRSLGQELGRDPGNGGEETAVLPATAELRGHRRPRHTAPARKLLPFHPGEPRRGQPERRSSGRQRHGH